MVVVIFRNRLREEHQGEYEATAPRMLALAREMPGFVSFADFTSKDGERVAVIEFETLEQVSAWREHPEHRAAQNAGRERFYSEYRLQICDLHRESKFHLDERFRVEDRRSPATQE